MQLLDHLVIHHGSEEHSIELYHGDLTAISPEEQVDILVISAFPFNYAPSPGTLMGALHDKGVEVDRLAHHPALDLRETFSCWLSDEIADPGLQFKRILCFEPLLRGQPTEVVGDIFQSLMPVVTTMQTQPITVAMPVVATGNQNVPLVEMFEPLLDAAVHWLALGLPVQHLKIVHNSERSAYELKGALAVLKQRYANLQIKANRRYKYDAFISYAHEDTDAANFLVDKLLKLKSGLRIFIDRQDLNPGHAWQQEIYEALDNAHKVIALYSGSYLQSKVCKEEFNIALFRHRDSDEGVLIPIYLQSADLPTYMKLIQFMDCREQDRAKLAAACSSIAQTLAVG